MLLFAPRKCSPIRKNRNQCAAFGRFIDQDVDTTRIALAQAGYRVAATDLREHGESSMGWKSVTGKDAISRRAGTSANRAAAALRFPA